MENKQTQQALDLFTTRICLFLFIFAIVPHPEILPNTLENIMLSSGDKQYKYFNLRYIEVKKLDFADLLLKTGLFTGTTDAVCPPTRSDVKV